MRSEILKIFSSLLLLLLVVAFGRIPKTLITPVSADVPVGNLIPSFTSPPAESPESRVATPSNEDDTLSFLATATDGNGDDYYLAICKSNAVTASDGAGAPTCDGGSWCVSAATASGSEASCGYVPQSGDSENNNWYGFVCDEYECSTADQGSGIPGSPFVVNHYPAFGSVSNNGPKDPGQYVTWSTSSTSDSDSYGASDTVKLVVCDSQGITSGACDGNEFCSSSLTASNPSCSYLVPTPTDDGSYTAYAYVVDNHNLGYDTGIESSNGDFGVNSTTPTITSVSINSSSDINLTEGDYTSVIVHGTVSDDNGCSDIQIVTTRTFRSGIGVGGCSATNYNNCYKQYVCSVVTSGNTCTGAGDLSADYECDIDFSYHTESTDASSLYPTENWTSIMSARDYALHIGNTYVSTNVEVISLAALSVTGTMDYGSLAPGSTVDPLSVLVTVNASGNTGINAELSGTDLSGATGTIAVGNQKYSDTVSTAYSSGTTLTSSAVELSLLIPKTTTFGSPESAPVYWGISIPNETPAEAYTGTVTYTAVMTDTGDW